MEIENYKLNKVKYINKEKLAPQWPFRLLISGNSSSGKTNLVLNLIIKYLYFDKLYVFARDIEEPAYVLLREIYESEELRNEIESTFSSDPNEIINVDDLDAEKQNLIIIDDYVTTRDQSSIEDLFVRGRKKNASIIYVTQSYYKVPKTIRLQCNYIILFSSCAEKDINLILKEFCLDYKLTKNIYLEATETPFNFLTLDFQKYEGSVYRKNFSPLK